MSGKRPAQAPTTRARPRPLYVYLTPDDRAVLDALVAAAGHARGRPATVAEVIRRLVHDQAGRKKAVDLGG